MSIPGVARQMSLPRNNSRSGNESPFLGSVNSPAQHVSSPLSTGESTPKCKKMTIDDFELGKIIGDGSFAVVYLATEKKTGKQFAIKVLEKAHVVKEKKVKYVTLEKNVFEKLNSHPSFVRLYYTFHDARRLYYVLSYAENGELLHYIRKLGSFQEACAKHYAAEMVVALEYMHSQGIIHRDFKPENILLGSDMHLRITDFGTAKILAQPPPKLVSQTQVPSSPKMENQSLSVSDSVHDVMHEEGARKYNPSRVSVCEGTMDKNNCEEASRRSSFVGTAEYVSPELLKNKQTSMASDLWALGCIIYQIIAGRPPFKGVNEYQTFELVGNASYEFPSHFPEKARDLITNLLQVDPTKRLGCPEMGGYEVLKAHAFFEGTDWDVVLTMEPPELRPYLPAAGDGAEMMSNLNSGPDGTMAHTSVDFVVGLTGLKNKNKKTASLAIGDDDNIEDKISLKERRSSIMSARSDDMTSNFSSHVTIEEASQIDYSEWDHLMHKDEKVLLCGEVKKRRGLFYNTRIAILTDAPRILFLGVNDKKLKGEVDWAKTGDWRPELKSNKTFFLHTPRHTYYLDDMKNKASAWVHQINEQAKLKRNPKPDVEQQESCE
eukprot:CFRG4204T1